MNKYYHLISRKRKTLSLPLSGANTIHHTCGICYQNISPYSSESIMYSSSCNSRDINLQTSSERKRVTDLQKLTKMVLPK